MSQRFEEGCGKIRYESRDAVKKALRRHKGSFATLKSYKCAGCHGWHIGHGSTQFKEGR